MCGGKGTRLDAPTEKPLFVVGDHPLIHHVATALEGSQIETWYGVVSPHTPNTDTYLESKGIPRILTPGDGYTADLAQALDHPDITEPVLTVTADLPLLTGPLIDQTLATYTSGSLTVQVRPALKRLLGVSRDPELSGEDHAGVPVGLNIVDEGEDERLLSFDARLAINVNTRGDGEIAEALL